MLSLEKMKKFLEYVAEDLLSKYGTDLSRIAVVFPNKRASLFLNEYLARLAGRPIWSPAYITISELFCSHSDRKIADPIKLVCDLHRCFMACTGYDETLDHFYGWGQLLLSDFDDLDKNMAPANRVFANLRDIHELDDVSYLTDEQREMIRRFFSNFSEEHNSELKRRFLQLWSHIGDIYEMYNHRLAEQGLAYEGALYRQVANDESITFQYDCYLFIGFNLLQQVEQMLFRRLKKEGKARFYWDFDHYYIGKNEAGHYISQYLADFPNELDSNDAGIYNCFGRKKDVAFVSAPTENIQARYISTWLAERQRVSDGRNTAIVLCNEGLLQTVIHCLPDEVDKVNITTGYPLNQSPIASLVTLLINLQTSGYSQKNQQFRLRYVNAVLRHPYARYVSSAYKTLYEELNASKVYYPSQEQLHKDDALAVLFDATVANAPLSDFNAALLVWLTRIIRHIAQTIQEEPAGTADPLTGEALFRMYTLLNRLCGLIESGDLTVDITTLQRLVGQLVTSTTIPFHGEPAVGIQIMGVLETRNLDFDHVLLLSCNEGNMPKGVSDTSFIPYSIRKAYGLTTVDNKVAIYAYYFHRLLQRASDVTLVYNNATNDGQQGEMSRFMLQMMVESRHKIRFQTLQAGLALNIRHPKPVAKTEAVMQLLQQRFSRDNGGISPTAVNRYLRCPLQFFYHYVCNILEPDDNEEDLIDNRVFGNIFHQAAQIIYTDMSQRSPRIMPADIDSLLKSGVEIERAVDDAFKSELFAIKDPSRPLPPFDGLQIINREVIIRYVRLLLEVDRRLAPFTILGLERDVKGTFRVNEHFTTTIGGRIDRLDCINTPDGGERIRVIDYKTGSKRLKTFADVEAIFDPANIREHSDYYLQTFLYSILQRRNTNGTPVSPALLFIQHAGSEDYDPILSLGKTPVGDIADISDLFLQKLHEIIGDIFNPDISFCPTDFRQRCSNCPYAALCGSIL